MRKRIYEIISASDGRDKLSSAYDFFMIAVILLSLLPLAFKQTYVGFEIAIVALPAGIITAGYMEELARLRDEEKKKK